MSVCLYEIFAILGKFKNEMTASSLVRTSDKWRQVSPDTVSLLNHGGFSFSNKKWQMNHLTKFYWTKKVKLQRRMAFSKMYNLIKIKTSTTNLNRELFLTRSFNRPNALGFMQNPPGFKELKIFQNCNFFPPFFFDTRNRLPPTLSYVAAPATIYPPTNPTYFRERYAFW